LGKRLTGQMTTRKKRKLATTFCPARKENILGVRASKNNLVKQENARMQGEAGFGAKGGTNGGGVGQGKGSCKLHEMRNLNSGRNLPPRPRTKSMTSKRKKTSPTTKKSPWKTRGKNKHLTTRKGVGLPIPQNTPTMCGVAKPKRRGWIKTWAILFPIRRRKLIKRRALENHKRVSSCHKPLTDGNIPGYSKLHI